MNTPLVSVIVPIYNVEQYLHRCLNSLAHQTLNEIEIIVIDDGSTDNSLNIAKSFEKKYPDQFIVIQKDNSGVADSRNMGILQAKGKYLGFVDSDDFVDETMYEKLFTKANQQNADISVCAYYGLNEKNGTFRPFQFGRMEFFNKSMKEAPELLRVNSSYVWHKLFRREFIIDNCITFPTGVIFEDMYFAWIAISKANKIVKVDEALYYHVLSRQGSYMSSYSMKLFHLFDVLEMIQNEFLNDEDMKKHMDMLEFVSIKHSIMRLQDLPKCPNQKLKKAMIKKVFDFLDEKYPNWRTNKIFFEEQFGNRIGKNLIKYRMFWNIYRFIPYKGMQIGKKCIMFISKAKNLIKKWEHISEFSYARMCKTKPLIENRVLFESFHGTTVSDSPFAMMKELQDTSSNYELIIATKKNKISEHQNLLNHYGIKAKLVIIYSKDYQEALATSKFLVNNVSWPPYFALREGQKYINTWHGTPMKTLGKKRQLAIQDMSNMQRNFLHSTHLLFPNEYTKKSMFEDYNLEKLYSGNSIVQGYPRNTIFFNQKSAQEIRKKYNFNDKQAIAYMPTWQGSASYAIDMKKIEEDMLHYLKHIDELLRDNQIMFIHLHSLLEDKIEIKGFKHIQKFPELEDNNYFLNACDALITDYSSVLFDYSLTGKKILLDLHDKEKYQNETGLQIQPEDLPFAKAYSLSDIQLFLNDINAYQPVDVEKFNSYKGKFLKWDSSNNTKIINDLFFKEDSKCHYEKEPVHLYFMKKIIDESGLPDLDRVANDPKGVAIFHRNDFTPVLQRYLLRKYNDKLCFLVSDKRMQLTLKEKVCKIFGFKLSEKAYQLEMHRILPFVEISQITDFQKSAYTRNLINGLHLKEVE